jgi:predicted TPR repeat methyltransferase
MSAIERLGPESEELSYEQALQLAVGLHRQGRLESAEQLYRQLLMLAPEDPNPAHFLGMLLHQQGRREEALELLERSVHADPSVAAWQNNLGNAWLETGRSEDAAAAYARAAELAPDNVDVLNNHACLLMRLDRLAEAEQSLRQALQRDEARVDAHFNIASLLARTGRMAQSFEHFARALELQPINPRVRRLLGVVYAQCGRMEDAARVFREWLALEPGNAQARHHLAAVTGLDVPERAADAYVADLFDRFAGSFDECLSNLEYQAPQRVGEALAQVLGMPPGHGQQRRLDVLDAGCGTGLCAPWLTPYARRLVGVDLSAGMLERARRRGGYDALEACELTIWLRSHPGTQDVIASADTLCYFGRLDDVLGAAANCLRRGGLLVFTVEARDEGEDYRIEPHGRYSHCARYVQASISAAGMTPLDMTRVVLRKEAGRPVAGWLVTAEKAQR